MDAHALFILPWMRRSAAILCASILLGAAQITPADGSPDTLTYNIRIGRNRLGSMIWITRDMADGMELETRTTLRVDRGTESLLCTQDILWKEDTLGDLERMSSVSTGMGPGAWRDSIGWLPERGLWRRTRARGIESMVDSLPGETLLGPGGLQRLCAEMGTGAIARLRMLDPERMRPVLYTIRRTGADTLRIAGGRPVRCAIFSVEDSSGPGTIVEQWRDAEGGLWREIDRSIDMICERSEIELEGSSAAERGDEATTPRFDVARWLLPPIVGAVPPGTPCTLILEPRAAGQAEPAGWNSPPLPDGPGQTISRGERAGTWIIRLDGPAPPAPPDSARALWSRDPALAGALRSGLFVDSASPMIRAFADETASQSAKDPAAEAFLFEKVVHDRIRLKDYSTAMGTASETLARGQGDCTEHAVLLAALCRARGIPARLVAGLTPQNTGEMAWHLWTEVWIGRWFALDATRGKGGLSPATVGILWMDSPEDEIENLEGSIGLLAGYRFRVQEGKE